MAEMSLEIDINPVPASRPRVTRWSTFYHPKYQAFKDEMASLLSNFKAEFRENGCPYSGPLECKVLFSIMLPKSYSEREKKRLEGTPCVSNMDIDNLEKALYDALNEIAYEDDKQIVEHWVKKVWVRDAGKINITIKQI